MIQAALLLGALFLAFQALAQSRTQPPDATTRRPLTMQDLARLKDRSPNETYPVMTTNGNTVAHFVNVIMDPQSNNQPRFAVLHLFDNVTENRPFTLVPWELLTLDPQHSDIVIQTSVEKLRKAPHYQQGNVPKSLEDGWARQVYAFYGVNSSKAAAVGSGMLPSGTIQGSDGNMPEPSNPARGSRVFLWTSVVASAFLLLFMLFRRRRVAGAE